MDIFFCQEYSKSCQVENIVFLFWFDGLYNYYNIANDNCYNTGHQFNSYTMHTISTTAVHRFNGCTSRERTQTKKELHAF